MECHDLVSKRIKAECNGAAPAMIGYEDIGEAAFGCLGRKIVSSIVYIELLGTCALLFILEVSIRRFKKPVCAEQLTEE